MSETDKGHDEFQLLLERARSGSQEAMCELIETYTPHIVRAVRRRLNKSIRAKFDSADFVQSVWASFVVAFRRAGGFDRPEHLMGYLAGIARNKVLEELRRRMELAKYNVSRERALDDSAFGLAERLSNGRPSPSEWAVADELWSRLLRRCPDHHRRIMELRRAGNTQKEIAEQLKLNERTVRRVIQEAFREWAR